MSEISKDEFLRWQRDPVTIEWLERLSQRRHEVMVNMSEGGTLNQHAGTTQGQTYRSVGIVEGLSEAINVTWDEEEESDE